MLKQSLSYVVGTLIFVAGICTRSQTPQPVLQANPECIALFLQLRNYGDNVFQPKLQATYPDELTGTANGIVAIEQWIGTMTDYRARIETCPCTPANRSAILESIDSQLAAQQNLLLSAYESAKSSGDDGRLQELVQIMRGFSRSGAPAH